MRPSRLKHWLGIAVVAGAVVVGYDKIVKPKLGH